MILRACALTVLLAALAGPAAAGSAPDLTCRFETGTSVSYENGDFATKAPAPISFEITSIDLDGQSAALLAGADQPKGKLAIARAIGANHFLEIATEGYWNVTTVYQTDPKTGAHPAVHSRHLGVGGQPVFAQYAGTCREK